MLFVPVRRQSEHTSRTSGRSRSIRRRDRCSGRPSTTAPIRGWIATTPASRSSPRTGRRSCSARRSTGVTTSAGGRPGRAGTQATSASSATGWPKPPETTFAREGSYDVESPAGIGGRAHGQWAHHRVHDRRAERGLQRGRHPGRRIKPGSELAVSAGEHHRPGQAPAAFFESEAPKGFRFDGRFRHAKSLADPRE